MMTERNNEPGKPASNALAGKHVVLGVTGSIAAFKAVALASDLTKRGAIVDVIMTESARQFVAPLSFQAITHRQTHTEMFALLSEVDIGHISLGLRADILVIAPATANILAQLAQGLANNLLLTTALATRAPILIAPAMEPLMYSHPATQANVELLRSRGAQIIEPVEGRLASGKVGRGRMVEPAEILRLIEERLGGSQIPQARDLAGKRVVVTAGPNHEPIDPVRYIANRSSGKMGYAIAEAAFARGAEVTLVSGPTALEPPKGAIVISVESARQMQEATEKALLGVYGGQDESGRPADILVMAAAVADYRVLDAADRKIKREKEGDITLRLIKNPDILGEIGQDERFARTFKVGFAAETNDLLENAASKLTRKGAQLFVANDVTRAGSGFGADTNEVVFLDWQGGSEPLPLMSKREVADALFDRVLALTPGFLDRLV